MGRNGYGPNWQWAKMVICGNDPKPGDLGTDSLLYKGHMIEILVMSVTSDYRYR